MKMSQRVVCITGMPRSGTSMIARIMNIMGLYLGPEESLLLETHYNVKGCWEHKELLEISNSIIYDLKLYESPRPDWLNSPEMAALVQKAKATIERDFGHCQLWGWKDDRCSLTLPFWRNIIPQIESVICVRNPCDVVKSLLKLKWDPSAEEGFARWLIHNSSVIRNTQGSRRLIVFYEDFMGEQWKSALRELAEFLGPLHVEKLPEYENEVSKFITKDLHHYNTSLQETMDNDDIPYGVKHFYSMLYSYAKNKGIQNKSEAERALQEFASCGYHEGYRLIQSAKVLQRYDRQAAEPGQKLAELNAQIAELNRQLDECNRKFNEQSNQLSDLLNSASWKATTPFRRLLDVLRKGTKAI